MTPSATPSALRIEQLRREDIAIGALFLAADHMDRKVRNDKSFAESTKDLTRAMFLTTAAIAIMALVVWFTNASDAILIALVAGAALWIVPDFRLHAFDVAQRESLKSEARAIEQRWREVGLTPQLLADALGCIAPSGTVEGWASYVDGPRSLVLSKVGVEALGRVQEAVSSHLKSLSQ